MSDKYLSLLPVMILSPQEAVKKIEPELLATPVGVTSRVIEKV
jgi:hypothetical protein